MTAPLRVGVYEYPGVVEGCVLTLSRLSRTAQCPDVGVSAKLLGQALDIAAIPYEIVPIHLAGHLAGSLNKTLGRWSGETLDEW